MPRDSRVAAGESAQRDLLAYLPEATLTTTLRVGVSSDLGKTSRGINTTTMEKRNSMPAGKEAILGKTRETKDGLVINSSVHHATEELRIVAVGKDGRMIEPRAKDYAGAAFFPGVSRRQLKEIKLQCRPYSFIEFTNVALQRFDKTPSAAEVKEAKLPASTRKILAALQTPTAAEFAQVPLREAIDNLKEARQIEMLWDEKVIADAKIDTEKPVTFKAQMTLQSDLECILDQLGLADVVTNEVLLITTVKEAKRLVNQGAIDPAVRRAPRAAITAPRIADALRSPSAPIEFVETPLVDVVEYLKDAHFIEIVIDRRSLNAAKIDETEPITLNLKDISLASALTLLLRNVGLTYVAKDEYILITTPEKAAEIKSSSSASPRWFSAGPGYSELNRLLSSRADKVTQSAPFSRTISWRSFRNRDPARPLYCFSPSITQTRTCRRRYKDMLPTPWTKIEEAFRKGETVESVGSFWQRRVVLLAAPTVAQLEKLIRETELLKNGLGCSDFRRDVHQGTA